jgi:hypothetical protein
MLGDRLGIDCACVTRRCQYFVLTFSHLNIRRKGGRRRSSPRPRTRQLQGAARSRTSLMSGWKFTKRLLCRRDGVDVDQPLGVWVTGSALPSARSRPVNVSVPTHSAGSELLVASNACRQVSTDHWRTLYTLRDDMRLARIIASESRTLVAHLRHRFTAGMTHCRVDAFRRGHAGLRTRLRRAAWAPLWCSPGWAWWGPTTQVEPVSGVLSWADVVMY